MMRWARLAPVDWPAAAFGQLLAAGFETWALTPAPGSISIWSLDAPDRLAIILGAEGPGLTEASRRAASKRVRIPICADVDSLNVAAAAAVAFAVVSRPR